MVFLLTLAPTHLTQIGGKGFHLATVAANVHTASVPPGFCLPVDVFSAHMDACGIDATTASALAAQVGTTPDALAAVRARICDTPLSTTMLAAFASRLDPAKLYAVRSSGTMEDTAAQSFAGQYDTVLGVAGHPDSIEAAVKTCFASQFNDHVLSYLKRAQSSTAPFPKMSVVIQQQIESLAAGVLFSVNPSDCSAPTMVVEGVWGLGEGLVSGDVSNHTMLARYNGATVTQEQTSKTPQPHKYVCVGGTSVSVVPCTPVEASTSPFDAHGGLLKALVALGYDVSMSYGKPQDIEWAITASGDGFNLYLLQARPITALSLPRTFPRLNMMLASPACVFDETLCGNGYNQLAMQFEGSWGADIDLQVVFGRVYVSSSAFSAVWGSYPGPEYDLWWNNAWRGAEAMFNEFYDLHEPRLTATIGLLHGSRAASGASTSRALAAAAGRALFASASNTLPPSVSMMPRRQVSAQGLRALTDKALVAELQLLMAKYADSCCLSWTMGQCSGRFEDLVSTAHDTLLDEFGHDASPVLMHLYTGLETRDGDPLAALTVLAKAHSGNAALAAALEGFVAAPGDPWRLLDHTLPDVGCGKQADDIKRFLSTTYWCAESDEDFSAVHWGEDPTFPLVVYARIVAHGGGSTKEGVSDAAKARYLREREKLDVLATISDAGADLAIALDSLRLYLQWKEEVHRVYVRLGFFMKIILLELGRRMMSRDLGGLPKASLLFNCPPAIMTAFLALYGSGSPEEAAAARDLVTHSRLQNTLKSMWRNCVLPYALKPGRVTLRGGAGDDAPVGELEPVVTTATPAPPVDVLGVREAYRGVPCSSSDDGPIVGRVRVVKTLAESWKLAVGDIMVTRTTSPSWTPLFGIIKGIVLEEHSILSHGAVVAREYGINAVSGMRGATKAIEDGCWVRVDGERGVVEVLDVAVLEP